MASNVVHDSYVSSLVQEINESVKDLTSDDAFKNGEARVKVQEAARKLVSTLESPPEAIFRHAFEVRSLFSLDEWEMPNICHLDFSVAVHKTCNYPAIVPFAFRIR